MILSLFFVRASWLTDWNEQLTSKREQKKKNQTIVLISTTDNFFFRTIVVVFTWKNVLLFLLYYAYPSAFAMKANFYTCPEFFSLCECNKTHFYCVVFTAAVRMRVENISNNLYHISRKPTVSRSLPWRMMWLPTKV